MIRITLLLSLFFLSLSSQAARDYRCSYKSFYEESKRDLYISVYLGHFLDVGRTTNTGINATAVDKVQRVIASWIASGSIELYNVYWLDHGEAVFCIKLAKYHPSEFFFELEEIVSRHTLLGDEIKNAIVSLPDDTRPVHEVNTDLDCLGR